MGGHWHDIKGTRDGWTFLLVWRGINMLIAIMMLLCVYECVCVCVCAIILEIAISGLHLHITFTHCIAIMNLHRERKKPSEQLAELPGVQPGFLFTPDPAVTAKGPVNLPFTVRPKL